MVKLISPEYHARLFGSEQPARVLSIAQRKELAQFGLLDAPDNNPQVELPIPARVGSADIILPAIVEKWAPLRERLGQFLQRFATAETQQAVPRRNDCPQPGWHKFADGGTWVPVPTCMTGKVYVADYETGVVNGRWLPICAVVATERGEWYTWFNPGLWDASQREWLVPLYPEYPDSIGVAHNAGYERSFSLPQYDWQAETGYWFCTMSLVQGLRGMNNQQIPAYRKFSAEGRQFPWVKAATPSNLSEALRNVTGVSLDKSVRTDYLSRGQGFILASESTRGRTAFHRPKLGEVSEVTEEGELSDAGDGATVADMAGDVEWVEAGFKAAPGWEVVEVTTDPHDFRREVVDYCALDVWACAHLGARLWAEFEGEALDYRLRKTPRTSDITFAGMLLMSRERVPLSDRWKDYYNQAEAYRLKTEQYIASQLVRVSNDVCSQQSSCLWSEQLAESHKRGTAGWYKDFLADPTLGKTVVPLLLKVTWDGQPLRLVREGGKKFWQWLKPDGTVGVVPHPQDPTRYACSLLTKDLYPVEVCNPAAEQHLSVASWDGAIGAILDSARSIQNWVSLRKRVANVQSYDTGGRAADRTQ